MFPLLVPSSHLGAPFMIPRCSWGNFDWIAGGIGAKEAASLGVDLIASGGGGGAVAVLLLGVVLGMSVGDGDGLLQCAQGEPERDGGGPQEVVPPAGHEVAPGQEPRRRQEGGRGQIQEDLRGLRGMELHSVFLLYFTSR